MGDKLKSGSFVCLVLFLFWHTASSQPRNTGAISSGDCILSPTTHVRDELHTALQSGANLVYINLDLQDDGEVFYRLEKDLGIFEPWSWKRSTSRRGRSLLMLSDNYDMLSLSLLTIRVLYLDVTLTSSPSGCLGNMTSQEIYETLRTLLLNDFKVDATGDDPEGSGSFSRDEHVCYREIRRREDDKAEFVYVCCHNELERLILPGPGSPEKKAVCTDVVRDPWISLLLAAIILFKVLVVLFSPSLVPETLYRLKYGTLKYVYHLPKDQTVTLRMVKTTTPWIYENDDRVVKLSKVPGMPRLRETVDTWQLDRVHDVTVKNAQLAVRSRKLLGENVVPVGIVQVIYNNLFLCRIRHLSALAGCCNTNILGTLNPGISLPTWFKCARLFARVCLLVLLVMPWVIRLILYYQFERPVAATKERAAEAADMGVPFTGNVILYLSPVHGLFVVCYVILCIDSLAYGVLSQAVKAKMKLVLRRCLRDMKERSKLTVCSWVTSILVLPCTFCGLLGLLLSPLFLLLLLPLLVPVLGFYLFPAINLSIRLLMHVFIFACPSSIARAIFNLWNKLFARLYSRVNKHVRFETLTAEESFEKKNSFSKWELPFQVLVVLVCLVSFWSVTFLMMELLSFGVEMAVYTFIGLIVTADVTSQYLTVIIFVVIYGNRCFSAVRQKYLSYHQVLHREILTMMRKEIDNVARTEEIDQENTALRVQGDMAPPTDRPPVNLTVREGQPRWSTSSILLFLDSQDTPFTTERFFEETVNLNYCGCPGLLYVNFLRALWSFVKILIFLLFVFVVVMAFGNAYRVSSTNQLLATVAGSIVPFVFLRILFKSNQGVSVDTQSIQFRTQFHSVINAYEQNWPVFDIEPEDTKPKRTAKLDEETKVLKTLTPHDIPPLSSSTPYSSLGASSRPTSSVGSDNAESDDWDDIPIDIIFDVSGKGGAGRGGAHALSALDEKEAGSQTMLNRSRDKNEMGGSGGADGGGTLGRSGRYKPSEPSLPENDELLPV
ncbi:uncharacterized protein [Littorina saxatilis]|uniref:Uncharacterized protein n=1 Tax=Littorina saxatilis TaxID=31220 RepID=A0AAN9B9P8_9CAEN